MLQLLGFSQFQNFLLEHLVELNLLDHHPCFHELLLQDVLHGCRGGCSMQPLRPQLNWMFMESVWSNWQNIAARYFIWCAFSDFWSGQRDASLIQNHMFSFFHTSLTYLVLHCHVIAQSVGSQVLNVKNRWYVSVQFVYFGQDNHRFLSIFFIEPCSNYV